MGWALLAAVSAAALMLWFVPPATSNFYPRCPFFEATGLLCPGCGGTRALAALLHGGVREALKDNALLVLMAPFFPAYFGVGFYRQWRCEKSVWPTVGRGQIAAVLVAAVAFSILRNLQ